MPNQTDQKQEETKEEKIIERIIPDIKPGMTIRVHQKIKEMGAKGERERIQVFEGIVLARKHGKEKGATITVRKISFGVAVEKIFPIDLPTIVKIEIVNQAKVRRAKLYFLRDYKKKLKIN
ncbi:50S ribosomal protein L19 [Candidatus Kuenenbacteria bacterium]|nr:50S ribosomal protein L19 [Candidatus Kuenenbacteria bacterium]